MGWKVFKENGLQALFSVILRIKGAADSNASAVSGLGIDLVRLAEKTSAVLDGKQDKAVAAAFTLPVTGWAQDGTDGYQYYYDITAPGVTATDRASVAFAPADIAKAAVCGICPSSETQEGIVRLRTASMPGTELSGEYWIEKGRK